MAEQRQPFRFRLPWLAPQRTAAQTQRPRPTSETPRTPSQPTTSVPISRPAFRPAGKAPTQPPASQPQPPPKAEAQSLPTTASRAATEPPKETPSAATAKPPSPSRPATEPSKETPSAATAKPPSPSRAATEPPKETPSAATAKAPSPSRPATDSKATSQSTSPSGETASAKHPSPSHVAAESQVSSKPASPPQTKTQSSAASVQLSPSQGDPKASADPPPPSRATSQVQLESGKSSQSQSPASAPTQKTNLEVSPPRKATQLEPTAGIVSKSPPSPEKSQAKAQAQSPAPQQEPKKESPSRKATQLEPKVGIASQYPPSPEKSQAKPQLQTPAPQKEPKKEETSQQPLQEPKSHVEITSSPTKITTSQDVAVAGEHKEVPVPVATVGTISREAAEAPAPPQKSNLSINGRDQKPVSEEKESEEPEETKQTVQELPKEENINRAAYEEQIQKTISEHVDLAPGPGKDTKDIRRIALKRKQKRETSDKSISTFQKHVLPAEEEALQQKEIRENISKLVSKLTTGHQVDDKPVTVITLTGDNRGASMHLSSEPAKKEAPVHIHRGYKANPYDSPETETTTDGEVGNRGERFGDQMKREASSPKAYLNSNVQSVNNSIVFNASVTERNPGIQLAYSLNTAEAIKPDRKSESLQTHKAEFTITPAEKITHEPTVRRRCLRGLFMESSDSDPDNPDKPRHHGCRYSCGAKSKDNETGFF